MAQPLRRTTAARVYAEHLRALMDQLRSDPLDEAKATALIVHIVDNRAPAARLYEVMEDQKVVALC